MLIPNILRKTAFVIYFPTLTLHPRSNKNPYIPSFPLFLRRSNHMAASDNINHDPGISGAVRHRTADINSKSRTKASYLKDQSIDIYIRMEENYEKDYCFCVPADQPVSFLDKIFETIPVKLSPGYFYHDKAETFAVSVHPGYLTDQGCLLFGEKAHEHKFQKPLSNSSVIGDVICEGQLVIPQWKPHRGRKLGVILFLAIWLYLDLPEFISPTPGTAPTSILFSLAQEYLPIPERPKNDYFQMPVWQCLFFVFHLIKVCFFYMILWNGAWHPSTLNPFSSRDTRHNKKKIPKPADLVSIGWTGVRRTTIDEWTRKCLAYRTNIAGGTVAAFSKGLYTNPVGYHLHPEEGWAVLKKKSINEVNVLNDLVDEENKFIVSKAYFEELSKPLSVLLKSNGLSESDASVKIREFREFGYLNGSSVLQKLFQDLVPMHPKKKHI